MGRTAEEQSMEYLLPSLPQSLIARLVVLQVPSLLSWKRMELCNPRGNGQLAQLARAWC